MVTCYDGSCTYWAALTCIGVQLIDLGQGIWHMRNWQTPPCGCLCVCMGRIRALMMRVFSHADLVITMDAVHDMARPDHVVPLVRKVSLV